MNTGPKEPRKGHDFDTSLEAGTRGERWLVDRHRATLRPAPRGERRFDLIDSSHPVERRVELKTDAHDPSTTPNFFMERWVVRLGTGHARGQAPRQEGGPWRALADRVDVFVYLFLPPEENRWPAVAWWFSDLPALVGVLDELQATKAAAWRACYNVGNRAEGLLVRRDVLEGLLSATCRRVVYHG